MRKGKKLLALDLDGTTVDSKGIMHQATIDALNALRAAGHVVCYVTGRREYDMVNVQYQYGCTDYVILNTGSAIQDVAAGSYLFSRHVDPATVRRLIEVCQSRGWQLYVITAERFGINCVTPGVLDYIEKTGAEYLVYERPEDMDLSAVEGFMVARDRNEIVAYIRENDLPLECVCSEPECYDITPKGVSKWTSVQYLANRLGIETRDIVAVGNWLNDLEMITCAGTGVAVGDAIQELKDAADYVTPHGHNEDAVVDVCRHCFGLKEQEGRMYVEV